MWLQPTGDGKKHHVVEQYNDCGVLAENAKLRSSDVLKDVKTVLHEGEKIEYWFRIPNNALFKEFKRAYPEVWDMIESADESIRMRGSQQMSILKPEWVIQKR